MKISKIYLRICSLLFACFLVCGSILRPVVTYASPYDLIINTDSNALMTLDLDDTDYLMMSPRSSIGTVTNTVTGNFDVIAWYKNSDGVITSLSAVPVLKNGRYDFKILDTDLPDGYYLYCWEIWMDGKNLPPPGSYALSFDFSSDFSVVDYTGFSLQGRKLIDNASVQSGGITLNANMRQESGDLYLSPININMTNLDRLIWIFDVPHAHGYRNVAGSLAFNFTKIESGNYSTLVGSNTSDEDYQSDVSSSLSDLSSSVDSMTEDLSSAAENLEYISTSQNLIIQGIDNVVMHISDQLFAFWNQLFNLIHVPTMAKMDDIIDAIRNMDLEIEVNLDGLKQSIQQASQNEIANDNKISADQIVNDEANTEEVKEAVKEHGNFIIDGLKGLFIPSDEFFKSYFDDLYDYFSDRFGFLSFPIDLVIRIADLFLTSEKVDAVLTLPSFEISGYKVWDDYSFNFTEFLETSFPFLISAIQTVTSIGLIMAFVNLCQDKWNEVMRS